MRENADYVGDKFAEEARKIHFGETDPRGIYGEATPDEAQGLAEDGVGSCRSRCSRTTATETADPADPLAHPQFLRVSHPASRMKSLWDSGLRPAAGDRRRCSA